MGEDSSVSLDNLRANWTPSQDQYFLELMLSQVRKGNKTGGVFTRQAWVDMIEQFNTQFGFKYDVEVLKNRYKRFRKQYNDIKMIVGLKGFKWDGTQNMLIADGKTWDECIKAHPDAQPLKTRIVPYYNDLCIIFGHAVADGRYSLSCFDVDFEYVEKELDDKTTADEGMDDQTAPAATKQGKHDWSPMMDQFFVELMLDQLRKGNKIGRTFKRKAWVDMTESFNDRFGCHCGRGVLRNRFNVLRRHYSSINVLLGKEGFSWDKTQHKVVAADHVWQKCIRVHYNFRLYKTKSMPFYSGLCIIYKEVLHIGGEKNSARDSQSLANAENEALQHVGKNASGHLKRHQPKMPPTWNESKKAREHVALAVPSLTMKPKKEDNFSVDNVITVLQAIPGLDDDLILDACDFLEDERRGRMFLALAAHLRKKWLLRKLRSE
uniref:Myb/SANT-like domain-containing protein n=1 Tax=Cajanus cajan TaxID=3821 RepID=A0A151S3S9_CAJCA|nr:hypothetical protein KK1_028813 [Cajanus cajan]